MKISTTDRGNKILIKITGRLNKENSHLLTNEFYRNLKTEGKEIYIDMNQIGGQEIYTFGVIIDCSIILGKKRPTKMLRVINYPDLFKNLAIKSNVYHRLHFCDKF